jgi:hypothetical protein
MILSRLNIANLLRIGFLAVAVVVISGMAPAFAQVATLSDAQVQVAQQLDYIPKLISFIAYAIAAFFAASGLLKLKDWINEPEKNPLNAVLFRLVVASLLLCLPKAIYIIDGSIFGSQGANGNCPGCPQDSNVQVPMQSLNTFSKK